MTKQSKQWLFWLAVILLLFLFIYAIRSVLLPFILGMATAYFLDPAADKLQKWGLSRNTSTALLTAVFFISIIVVCMLIAPVLGNQLSALVVVLPTYIQSIDENLWPQLSQWFGGLPAEYMTNIKASLSGATDLLVRVLGGFVSNIFSSGFALVNLLSLILITPVVAFYLLRDWDGVVNKIDGLLPRKEAPIIREQLAIINQTLAGFVRGQLNVCLLLAVYYALGLSLVGLNFGIIIGLATGFLVIFPYVGLLLGMSVGVAVAFFQFSDISSVLLVLAVFVSGQIIEGNFITPKLVGDKVGLHPVWIIFALLAGAAMFGFVGVLLAVPVAAVVGVLIRFMLSRYVQSSYYND